ncbi:MAG: hypothetical protein JSR66_03175 [Proteobacteria bacterium]|nr:hypothetical protein [Pseudomonadota bacterium]
MNLEINLHYTLFAQSHSEIPEIDYVYSDDEFIVERHFVRGAAEFEYRLVVKRRDGRPIGDWRTLQDAKNQVVGPERVAIQFFPRESEVTDTANNYHLWVYKMGQEPKVRLDP